MSLLNKACFIGGSAVIIVAVGGGIDLGKKSPPSGGEEDYATTSAGGTSSPPKPAANPYNTNSMTGVDPSTLPPGDGNISRSAENMIGVSTAGIPGTDGGNLGCAAAVSMIFQNATGQQLVPGQNLTLGTSQLYSSLRGDSRFVEVSFANAAPGDIVVTAAGSQAGHTGVVTSDNRIISNSSGGFNGSAPGTIQNNYSVSGWSSVTARNPGQTGVFRYVGG
jgi:hypothetical protein